MARDYSAIRWLASMRPPLNAGENCESVMDRCAASAASMRPPLNAGENRPFQQRCDIFRRASMRPPLNAGENASRSTPPTPTRSASMRPPLNAGENVDVGGHAVERDWRFNEAPAERGGKPLLDD